MQKILYITDLDGTFLNENIEVSKESQEIINNLIKKGLCFSVATARTDATASKMLEGVSVNYPIVLMNGVLIYDLKLKKYENVFKMSTESVKTIISEMQKCDVTGFMYSIKENEMYFYYENLDTPFRKNFHDERTTKFNKIFSKVQSFFEVTEDVIYFSLLEKEENLKRLYEKIKNVHGICVEYYKDIYTKDLWYMEIFSDKASKYSGVNYLRDKFKFDKIIGFGDNLNDISLFKACDECYAVNNARDELKKIATSQIGSNKENGVAKFINDTFLCE